MTLIADRVRAAHRAQFDAEGLPLVAAPRKIADMAREAGGRQQSARWAVWGFIFSDRSELWWGADPATVRDPRVRMLMAEGNAARALDYPPIVEEDADADA